jgi:hypothetical protein
VKIFVSFDVNKVEAEDGLVCTSELQNNIAACIGVERSISVTKGSRKPSVEWKELARLLALKRRSEF